MQALIRPLSLDDIPTAHSIFQNAFDALNQGSSHGRYTGDVSYMERYFSESTSAFAAEVEGKLVGSNFAIRWGSFGLFGPLTVHPEMWGNGIAQQLIEPAMDCFQQWGISQIGFFTRANSPKHLYLYQKFGFFPRFLTAILSKSIALSDRSLKAICYGTLLLEKRSQSLTQIQQLTARIYEGLDLTSEIQVVKAHNLGETLLLLDGDDLVGFAICHYGSGTEAGQNTCYIKFGAVHPDVKGEQVFTALVNECEVFATLKGGTRLVAGVSTARQEAYQQLSRLGFKTDRLGVAMHRPSQDSFCCPGVYVIDDWR